MEKNKNIEIISQPELVSMAREWFSIAQENHFWMKARFDFIRQRLSSADIDLRNSHLLEIGCGHGQLLKQFESCYFNEVDGCDLDIEALKQIHGTKGKVYCLDIFDQPPKLLKSYDGIILADVIEHIENDLEFVKTSLKYLKPGGLVIVNVPALSSLFSKYDTVAGHHRRYNRKKLHLLFEALEIDPISVRYWGSTMLPIAFVRKLMLQFVAEEKVILKGFKPPTSLLNSLLSQLLKIESFCLRWLGVGTSLIAIGRWNGASKR